MRRFLFWTFIFAIACGLLIHYQVSVPVVGGFLGKLPGDLIIKKGGLKIYFPLASAAIASILLCTARRYVFKG